MQLLTPFPTRALLPLTVVSQRFHNIILRILHYRLLLAASLKEYRLILECYHPSTRFTEPYLFCTYLGTDGLSSKHEGEGSLYENCSNSGRLGKLGGLYSRFRPVRPEEEKNVSRPHPAGGDWSAPIFSNDPEASNAEKLVSHNVNLESHELFSQLCSITNLVKMGPRRGVFLSCVNLSDGVVRIWREWLAQQASKKTEEEIDPETTSIGAPDGRMLWVDGKNNVGLKVRVSRKRWNRQIPVLLHRDDEESVSYSVELKGNVARDALYWLVNNTFAELQVRTTHLLLAVEQSLEEQNNHSGKALIIGSFAAEADEVRGL